MTGQHVQAQARRVVTGVSPDGRSLVVSDEFTPHRRVQAGNVMCEVWRVPGLPVSVEDGDGLGGDRLSVQPPAGGLVHMVVTFPPDSEWDRSQGWSDANGKKLTARDSDDGEIPGLHTTNTVDIVTVLNGELICQLHEGDVVLHPGDTLVQRGTAHSWSNRTDTTTTIVAVMIGADDKTVA